MNRQHSYRCVFCDELVKGDGKIQFNEEGEVIGICGKCLKIAELFVKEGRNVKPKSKRSFKTTK